LVKKVVNKFPDTLFLAISDHGMLDTQDIKISSIPGFKETLSKDCIAIEGRFASFFVKDKEKFVEIFNNTPILKDNFVIQSREEVLANHLFGYSKTQNKIALDTIGDFTLLATNKYCLVDDYAGPKSLKARHAGITDDEVNIYLQAYNYK
jgi:hypothetical protein